MAFSTLLFFFGFLPISLIIYYLCPKRLRPIPLVLLSLLFYAWPNPVYLVLLLLSMGVNYFTALQIDACRKAERPGAARLAMILALVFNLGLLVYFKYYGFLVSNLNLVTGWDLTVPVLKLPLGLSFYTFTVLSYVLDVYMDRAPAEKNVLGFAVYATFFPKLISGPITQYKDMREQLLSEKPFNLSGLSGGMAMFLAGLFKKVLISDNLGTVFSMISGQETMSAGTAWLGMILYSLQLYYDFSGYSDMAIGVASMFGFKLDKNFDYPYRSVNITDFWRRWHISLGAWFREYLYFPLGGSRCSKAKLFRNLLIVWLATGLWHGASWTFIAWGLWHGGWSMLERFVIKDRLDRVPKALRILATDLLAFLGWVMFFSPTLSSMLHYFGQMAGAGGLGLFDGAFGYFLGSCWPLLIVSLIGSGPTVRNLFRNQVYRRGGWTRWAALAVCLVLLLFTVSEMVSSTYNSFLYFQF